MEDVLRITGAKQHNLKNISCEIPRNQLVVITGPSGSGKSSLAFDTIYAEGQRRYVESLSAYARQFLDQLPRPDVESIDGLSPAIAIEQRSLTSNPRSTVGTVTEIADYLRVLFANVGVAHCPRSGKPLKAYTVQEIVDEVLTWPKGTRFILLAPLGRDLSGDLKLELEQLRRHGFVRARVDGSYVELADDPSFNDQQQHSIEAVIDRLSVRDGLRQRLTDSVELALSKGDGTLLIDCMNETPPLVMSERLVSWEYGIKLPPLEPRLFSFNSPYGACPTCNGLGRSLRVDPDRLVVDDRKSLRQGVLLPLGVRGSRGLERELAQAHKQLGVNLDIAWAQLSEAVRARLLFGADAPKKAKGSHRGEPYLGIVPRLERQLAAILSNDAAEDGAIDPRPFTSEQLCPSCNGTRLREEAHHVRVGDFSYAQLSSQPLVELQTTLTKLGSELDGAKRSVAEPLLHTVDQRLGFLLEVGLGYLSLDRAANSLSGGEGQRIRLATQIGSALVGVLYVLDEPSVGLHPRDNANLLHALRQLVSKGNTVLVVEHDKDLIMAADHILDLGPAAGEHGGRLVATGSPLQLAENANSVTGPYLSGKKRIAAPARNVPRRSGTIDILGAHAHNLRRVNASFPLGQLTVVTGVSGSGKSSLVLDALLPALRNATAGSTAVAGPFDALRGITSVDKVIAIDQAPIGRTPRSNPATYTGIFSQLRDLYASLPEARARGYKAGRFSFNVKGGRCEKCQGDGVLRVEMHFLPDMYVPCDACGGDRYNRETLEIIYRGKNIAEALRMTADEASEVLAAIPKIAQRLQPLRELGLGYLRLGQPAPTLSGGEAQRLKLASELARPTKEHTLYILDEPTSGLHFADVELLLTALNSLCDRGHTVIVIEHHLELIAAADWVIDLGPGGGTEGGNVIVSGSPAQVAACPASHTGQALLPYLKPAAKGHKAKSRMRSNVN